MSDRSSKTEKPTPRRLQEARKQGQVPRTPEVGAWATVLVATWLLPGLVRHLLDTGAARLGAVQRVAASPDPAVLLPLLGRGLRDAVTLAVPFGLPLAAAAVLAAAAQGGLRPAPALLKPKLSKLSPIAGLKRMAGPQGMWEGGKAVLKTTVMALAAYSSISSTVPPLLDVGRLSLAAVCASTAAALLNLVRTVAVAGLVLAVFDYAVVRRRIMGQLRMSKEDLKEEHKREEGDPQIKGKIRSRQLEMSRNRMMSAVADADVVVVNPTHVAVALKYDPARGAPRVVAKGVGTVAEKIRQRATEHRVPLVRDVPLARTLHRICDLDDEIPPDLYAAVAKVLAFVFGLRARGAVVAGEHRVPA